MMYFFLSDRAEILNFIRESWVGKYPRGGGFVPTVPNCTKFGTIWTDRGRDLEIRNEVTMMKFSMDIPKKF